jgi:hypothetical protein
MARSTWADWTGAAPPDRACGRHPDETEAARCGDCQRGMCRRCFDEAPWPWKVCASCHAARVAAAGAPTAS